MKIIYSFLILAGLSFSSTAQDSTFPYLSSENLGINFTALSNISQLIDINVENGEIIGAELLIIKNRKTVLHDTFGWKDLEDSITMSVNTIFNLRSMTKTFTGAGIQILIDQGKLKYNSKASEYIPGFINEKVINITIKQLLTHTSGLPVSIVKDFDEFSSLLEMANAIGEYGPQFQAGERFQYSDAGADVLGAIIEVVSDTSLYSFLEQNLFTPLGMSNTYPITQETDLRNNRVASSYGGSPGNWTRFWTPDDKPFYQYPWGSQSFYGTPLDYARFLVMWMDTGISGNSRILSTQSAHNTLTPVCEFRLPVSEMGYSTGFPDNKVYHGQMSMLFCETNESDEPQVKAVGYGGSDGTFAWAWPDEDLIVLLFTQSRNFSNSFPFKEFEYIVYKNLINPNWVDETEIISQFYKQYIGTYITDFQGIKDVKFEIIMHNEGLAFIIPDQPAFDLNDPNSEGSWVFKLTELISVTFKENDSNEIESLTLSQVTQFQKTVNDITNENETASVFQEYSGNYIMPSMAIEISVLIKDGDLAIQFGGGKPTLLTYNEKSGQWLFKSDNNKCLKFIFDKEGEVKALNIIDLLEIPRYSSKNQEKI
ncbi:MAG: beta-lactamase family protein [Bacteroidales bacterium]|nr:beta-lactamase family protein [Bacteroidales bacterium]